MDSRDTYQNFHKFTVVLPSSLILTIDVSCKDEWFFCKFSRTWRYDLTIPSTNITICIRFLSGRIIVIFPEPTTKKTKKSETNKKNPHWLRIFLLFCSWSFRRSLFCLFFRGFFAGASTASTVGVAGVSEVVLSCVSLDRKSRFSRLHLDQRNDLCFEILTSWNLLLNIFGEFIWDLRKVDQTWYTTLKNHKHSKLRYEVLVHSQYHQLYIAHETCLPRIRLKTLCWEKSCQNLHQ